MTKVKFNQANSTYNKPEFKQYHTNLVFKKLDFNDEKNHQKRIIQLHRRQISKQVRDSRNLENQIFFDRKRRTQSFLVFVGLSYIINLVALLFRKVRFARFRRDRRRMLQFTARYRFLKRMSKLGFDLEERSLRKIVNTF